jgi:hypothetical protein
LDETDKPQGTHDVIALQDKPAVWRYRAMISVNHLRQHIGAAKLKLPVLRLFLQEVTIDFKNLNLILAGIILIQVISVLQHLYVV